MTKYILIFGCNSAILNDSIKYYLKTGHKVVGVSRNNSSKFINSKNFHYIKFDVERNDINKLAKQISKKFQIGSIIYAIGGSKGNNEILVQSKIWKEVWWFNFGYTIDVNNHFLPLMKKKKFGRVLYFSSTAVNIKTGSAIYSSTKTVIEDYVKKMGRNYAKNNIFFNAIKTSLVSDKSNNWFKYEKKTSKKNTKKMLKENLAVENFGRSSHFEYLITYLNSEKNKFLTGSVIDIDGGFLK